MKNSGFTLIEVLIYLALFALVIGGGMVAVYQIIDSTNKTNDKVVIQEDADFLLRKLDWALTGAFASEVTFTSTTLTVAKFGIPTMIFSWDGSNNMELDSKVLNSSFVKVEPVSGVMFNKPFSSQVDITFTVNGQRFNETKYLH